jgi:excisionase family DNA binding protein
VPEKVPPLTINQAARALELSVGRVRALCNSGRLEFEMTPLGRLISVESVEKLKKARREVGLS